MLSVSFPTSERFLVGCRLTSPDQGSLAVVVAPVLRFLDVGFNADVHIEELGPPDKLISGFAPELFGSPLTVSAFAEIIGVQSRRRCRGCTLKQP